MMGVVSGLQYDLEMEWRMTKRMTFVPYPLFKLKQLSEENFMVAIPGAKRINLYDFHLTPSPIALQFSQEMQAIEHLHIQGRQFVFAGLKNGTLEGLELSFEEGQQGSMKLSLAEQAGHQIYINDMLYLGEGRMVNCYNTGNIAIWDVSTVQDRQQPVAYLKEVHESFVYKLRRIDQNRIVSCGHDQMANIIDLETTAITDSYYHSESVWCCYPVDENLLCSAGLLGYLQFKDIRIGQTVQALPLLTNETSFVTHLDANHLVFGDRRQVSRCDLRMIVREQQCPKGMKVSAEGILVNGQGGIAVGRGGDLCLFERGEQGPVQETNVRPDNTVFPIMINQFQNIMANFFNMQGMDPNNMHLFDQQSDQEEQQQMDDFQMDSEDDLL